MQSLRPSLRVLALCVPLLAGVACSAASGAVDDASEARVVGGSAESGFPAVGYLMIGNDAQTLHGPNCGATLIGAHVVVTASHCIVGQPSPKYGFGFGSVDSGAPLPAKRVFTHPSFHAVESNGVARYRHDVAVVILESDSSVPPAVIGAPEVGQTARYIGYGRTTPGGFGETSGYTGERKSTAERITQIDPMSIWTSGEGGGLCWGDSGGPIMRGNEILGVLADFDQVFDCREGNSMIFTSLVAERAFIDQAIACQDSTDPACLGTFESSVDGGLADGGLSEASFSDAGLSDAGADTDAHPDSAVQPDAAHDSGLSLDSGRGDAR